jgi:hypothetical protein
MFGKLFSIISHIATIAVVYNKLNDVSKAKEDIYTKLDPATQAEWNKVFGDPNLKITPMMTPPAVKVAPTPTNLQSIKAAV